MNAVTRTADALAVVVAGAVGVAGAALGAAGTDLLASLALGLAAVLVCGPVGGVAAGARPGRAVTGLVAGAALTLVALVGRAALGPATPGWIAAGALAGVTLACLGAVAAGRRTPPWAWLAGAAAVLAAPGAVGVAPPDGELVTRMALALAWGAAAGGVGLAAAGLLRRVRGADAETHTESEPTEERV